MTAMIAALLFSATASAAGGASPKPPPPPAVDLAALPASAKVHKPGADGKMHPVAAHLLFEQAAIPAGGTGAVGLYLVQEAGWHTYWKSPGSIGQPTEIRWTLPDGVQVTPHEYPVPQRFEDEGLVSFGYEDQVLLIADLTVDAGVAPGTYPISADANWLVCKTSCIPGDAHLEGFFVVGDAAPGAAAPLFSHFRAQHPSPPSVLSVEAAVDRTAVTPNGSFEVAFRITPAGGGRFDPLPSDGAWPTFTPVAASFDWMLAETDGVRVRRTDAGELLVRLKGDAFEPSPLPTADRIGGLVQATVNGEWVRAEVSAPLPWATTAEPSADPLWKRLEEGGLGVAAPVGGDEPPAPGPTERMTVAAADPAGSASVSLWMNLALAFVGGLILNVMPCVLPVLTLKLYSLVEQSDIQPREQRVAGAAYTAGIVASFWALAATVVGMRTVMGIDVDWGFQFQYPPYVAALATVVFAFGLSLFGVFELPTIGADTAGDAANKEGVVGYFFTGVFATLLATPCSAPFLGTAIAYAFAAPTPVLFAIFTMVGLGLAAPFLFIAFVPAAFRLLPRPGEWMDAFKNLLGFTLIATTVWLVDVLMAQVGPDGTTSFLVFLMFVALGAWVYGRWGGLAETGMRQLGAGVAGLTIAGVAGAAVLDLELDDTPTCDDGTVEVGASLDFSEHIPWQPFSEDRVAALSGNVVFIDFTADWCFTCKVNERTILETQAVRQVMDELDVVPLKADWTRADPVITEWLNRNQRAGVPMYLILPKDTSKPPILLPEVITASMVEAALREAT